MPMPIIPADITSRGVPPASTAGRRWLVALLTIHLTILMVGVGATEVQAGASPLPVAQDSNGFVWKNQEKTIQLNVSVVNFPAHITVISGPHHGTVTDVSTFSVDYRPDHDYVGDDAIVFQVSDAVSTSAPATLTLSVGTLRVNFQPQGTPIPVGYLGDSGGPFGPHADGPYYGWNLTSHALTRDRDDPKSPDQRFDTFIHMQKPENPSASYQISVPNGLYEVFAVCGDPAYTDSVYSLDIEGTPAVRGTPSAAARWISSPQGVLVRVRDGFLTVTNGAGALNNKLNFLTVRQLPSDLLHVVVNFQPPDFPVPADCVADSGEVFSKRADGLSYGWTRDNTGNARVRTGLFSPFPEELFSTFIHMQKPNNPDAVWEIAVPNGTYAVTGASGDAAYTDSVYRIQIEGIPFISGTPDPSIPIHFIQGDGLDSIFIMNVSDGRLTMRGFAGAINNKINFLNIIEEPISNN